MVKNVIILILALGALVGVYYFLSDYLRIDLNAGGKTEAIFRDDLTLPIQATGTVRASRTVEVKAEASGEVIEILKHAGEQVAKGELIIRLDKSEEQRSVDRAQRELDRVQALLAAARVTLEQRKTADIDQARADVAGIEANLPYYKRRADSVDDDPEVFHPEEMLLRKTTYEAQLAQLAAAKARLDTVEYAIELAEQDVAQREASYASTKSSLDDAQERLDKTDIVAPIDGILGDVSRPVQVGEVIQGGKTTITGGTPLAVILDMQPLLVRAEVDESWIGAVYKIAPAWARPGNDGTARMPEDLDEAVAAVEELAKVTVDAYRDDEFEGVIQRIYPQPTSVSGVTTYMVDVVIVSPDRDKLFHGMRAEVKFTAERVDDVLLCPNEAIHRGDNDQLGVYVPEPGDDPDRPGKRFVPCKFGLDNGVYSEVKEGLTQGQEVYTELPVERRDKD